MHSLIDPFSLRAKRQFLLFKAVVWRFKTPLEFYPVGVLLSTSAARMFKRSRTSALVLFKIIRL